MPSNRLTAFALTIVVAAVTTLSFAQDITITTDPALAALSPEEMVAKRQAIMKEDGGILKGAGALSGAEAVTAADHLIANLSNLTVLFPEGSAVGDTGALPVIWEKNADFQAILVTAVTAATAMKTAATAGDATAYADAIKAVGATCGQCHQTFRQKS
ncbi:c-type cytochrome [Devosia insulae]|uniref:c-type cytochrome n=1 Tax=Devosia insulae TaxID=408174 RepID=UPI000A071974|nr:cytochrome c [Devosia insulae]